MFNDNFVDNIAIREKPRKNVNNRNRLSKANLTHSFFMSLNSSAPFMSIITSSLELTRGHFSNLPALFSHCSALALRLKASVLHSLLQKIVNLLVVRFLSNCFYLSSLGCKVFDLL